MNYQYKPFIISAEEALRRKIISYAKNGDVLFVDAKKEKVRITPEHQFSLIRPTFEDVGKALSSTANSPKFADGKTLRQMFEEEYARYDKLAEKAEQKGLFEPVYGTYVYDGVNNNLFLIAPEFWHRLGLATNNSKLMTDPEKKLSWQEIRNVFDSAVIGFVGASVGGNILEGVMREIRPEVAKIADHDWIEITNLNRLEKGSLQFLTAAKSHRTNLKDSYDNPRINKADIAAYQQNMVDPYATFHVYSDGIHAGNIEQFLLGNNDEPKLDILVEEIDDLRMKVELRKQCRKHGIPVFMMSDFGHLVQGQFQDFKKDKTLPLGFQIPDDELEKKLESAMASGKREDRFNFIKALCGSEFEQEEFGMWTKGEGEQPTSSLPQSGATAMTSGGIGGKVLAMYLLGYKIPERFIYDLKTYTVS